MNLERDLRCGIGEKFGGSIRTYRAWRRRMAEYIQAAGSTATMTMEVLSANTEGIPKRMVDQLINSDMPVADQVEVILDRFDARYGSRAKVTKDLRDQLRLFPKIESESEVGRMDELLILLQSLTSGGSCSMFGSIEDLREVWERMPSSFISRWRGICGKLFAANREPQSEQLMDFMSYYIQECDMPYFAEPSSRLSKPHRVLRTAAITMCPVHELPHSLPECRAFLGWSCARRRELVRKHELCFRCLRGHFVRDCPFDSSCDKCDGDHHMLLHPVTQDKQTLQRERG